MPILVTGGGGFVGINLVERLLEVGERVVVFDRHGFPASTSEIACRCAHGLTVVTGDVANASQVNAVFGAFGIDRVVHTAAITADATREGGDPGQIVDVNVRGTLNVLCAAHAAQCVRVIYVGSGQAYGKTHDEGLRLHEETSPSRPADIYGITKFAAEQIALRLRELWRLDIVCIRLGSVCGPWEFATGVRDMLSPQLQIARLALRGEAAVIPANEPWRDWIYSRDAAAGLVAALRAEAPGHRLYHLASGMDWQGSFTQWCEALRQAYPRFSWRRAESGESPNVSFVVERDRAPMDISRIVGDLGFRPRFGPTEAYRDYLGWISGHQAFVADNARESPRQ